MNRGQLRDWKESLGGKDLVWELDLDLSCRLDEGGWLASALRIGAGAMLLKTPN